MNKEQRIMDALNKPEILQIIFSNIPLPELLKSTARVCQTWNNVINKDTRYLRFKKSYYKIINDQEDHCPSVKDLAKAADFVHTGSDPLEKCLPYILQKITSHPDIKLLNIPTECLKNAVHHKR